MKQFQLLALFSAISLGSVASAAGFQNGSFESGPNVGAFSQLGAGNTSIPSWTIGGHSVDYIGSYWNASNGSHSIDMSGGGAGVLAQSFDTLVGQTYLVTFDMAGNMDGGNVVKSLDVSAGATSANYTFGHDGPQPIQYGLVEQIVPVHRELDDVNSGVQQQRA